MVTVHTRTVVAGGYRSFPCFVLSAGRVFSVACPAQCRTRRRVLALVCNAIPLSFRLLNLWHGNGRMVSLRSAAGASLRGALRASQYKVGLLTA